MQKTAVIFGGTGFIGRQIVKALAEMNVRVIVPSRAPESAYFLKPAGDVGQVVPVHINLSDYNAIAQLLEGADFVVNAIGILYERKKGDFIRVHSDLVENIAAACAVAKVERFIHISAMGADSVQSEYAKSKLDGEQRAMKSYPHVTILRPSIVFGPDDDFFNRFAKMAQILPALPLIGGGLTKFQPVYVGDVVDSVLEALYTPRASDGNVQGKLYELGGPEVLTFKALYELMFSYTHQPRFLMPLPFAIAKIQAQILPDCILTVDQVESLKSDNIMSPHALGLDDLGVEATALETILPSYLTLYRPGGRFADA